MNLYSFVPPFFFDASSGHHSFHSYLTLYPFSYLFLSNTPFLFSSSLSLSLCLPVCLSICLFVCLPLSHTISHSLSLSLSLSIPLFCDQRLNSALLNGMIVCIDLSFDNDTCGDRHSGTVLTYYIKFEFSSESVDKSIHLPYTKMY